MANGSKSLDDSKVENFMARVYKKLEAEHWGDIEPGYFLKPEVYAIDDFHKEGFESLREIFKVELENLLNEK